MRWFAIWTMWAAAFPLTAFSAERVELTAARPDVSVTVLESNEQRVVLRFEINAFSKDAVDIAGEKFSALAILREGVLLNKGEPALPRLCRSIIIPDDGEMALEILSSAYRDFSATPIAPSKGNLPRNINPADVPYSFGTVYQGKDWYPAQLAALREPYILRDYRGTVIEVNAFQYLPSEKTLRVYTSVTVAVKVSGPGGANALYRSSLPAAVDPSFAVLYQEHFLNFDETDPSRYTAVHEEGEMLVITADSFRTAMQPFVNWKIQKGIRTTMVNVSTIGNTSTLIKNYIQNFYTTTGGNLAYVLLVGDAAQIATPTSGDSTFDPRYAKVAGSDNYPDIFVGRFSAQLIAHVTTQVERSVEYERDAVAGTAWYGRAAGIASAEGDGIGHNGGEIDYEHMNNIRTDLLAYGYTPVDQIYDPGATDVQVAAALNAGRGLANYTGHGSVTAWTTSGFNNTDVAALTNDNMLPFIFSVACVNGQFNTTTCFAEAWLRSTHSGQPIGALATYMASVNQSWLPPMDAQDEFNDLLCAQSKMSFGGLCFNASCKMMDLNGSEGIKMFDTWHIFGDPSVQVRTKAPLAMSVTHAATIPLGATSFTVTVSGVTGALCALSRNDTLYGFAYTNAGGQAVIPVSGTLPAGQTVKLTVTAFNKATYAADITVTSGPMITVVSPNGTETWVAGEVDTIKWTCYNLTEAVQIEINRGYPGGEWQSITPGTANTGAYPWLVTTPVTAAARIRIRGTVQTTVSDTSNGNFTIIQRLITVTAANGGEVWVTGEPRNILWTSENVTGSVKIDLMREFPGGTWEVITGSTGNTGTFPWTVTTPTSTTARIRISSLSFPSIADSSDGNFSIILPNSPPELAHYPLHDQTLAPFTVTAFATDDEPGFSVRMHYSLNGGLFDSLALAFTVNPDEYAATIGSLNAGTYDYYLQVRDIDNVTCETDTFSFDVRAAVGGELAYDDGTAEASHWSEQTGYRWAVRFDPPQSPFVLSAANIGISVENPDSFRSPIVVQVLLADGPSGMPGTLAWSKTVASIGNVIGGIPADQDGWTHAAICDISGNPLILAGSFYIAVSNPVWGQFEAFLQDTGSVFAAQSFVYDPCDSSWYGEGDADSSARRGNRLIRAVGMSLSAPTVTIMENNGFLLLNWTNTGAPVYHVYSAPAFDGVFSPLLITSDTTANLGRTDTLQVRSFYRVISASE